MRIMKGRKKLSLQLLIDEVVRDVGKRFPPDVKEIKKRVESLIEREVSWDVGGDEEVLGFVEIGERVEGGGGRYRSLDTGVSVIGAGRWTWTLDAGRWALAGELC